MLDALVGCCKYGELERDYTMSISMIDKCISWVNRGRMIEYFEVKNQVKPKPSHLKRFEI